MISRVFVAHSSLILTGPVGCAFTLKLMRSETQRVNQVLRRWCTLPLGTLTYHVPDSRASPESQGKSPGRFARQKKGPVKKTGKNWAQPVRALSGLQLRHPAPGDGEFIAPRKLALRPAHSRGHLYVTRYTEGFSHFVTSMTTPVASGWSVRRVGLAPTGKRRLLTAHANRGHPAAPKNSPIPIATVLW